jgi:hypothetical protein
MVRDRHLRLAFYGLSVHLFPDLPAVQREHSKFEKQIQFD